MRTLLILLFLLLSAPSYSEELLFREKCQKAHAGDFIVTQLDDTYSLLFVREITAERLLLEEIAAPSNQIDTKTIRWAEWVKKKAPGHTSWTLYEIDMKTGQLIEAFSYSKRGWLYLDETQQFLSKLLSLPLTLLSDAERKKIGPQPASSEEDRRAVWNPPLFIQGKKQPKAQCDVWKGVWPEDGTPMGKCTVELYFSKANPSFAFPYWIELRSPHYTFKMRSVDSGSAITSAFAGPIPRRPAPSTPLKKA